jgi:hypothetical protein
LSRGYFEAVLDKLLKTCAIIPHMRPERATRQPREILPQVATVSLDRARALEQVLGRFKLPFRAVANEGAHYPDGDARVPKGKVFVTYDTGEVPKEVIERMVTEIAPPPRFVDGRR